MKKGGITRRWILNTLSVIILILAVVNVSASLSIKEYYYAIAESTIDSKVQKSAVQSFFKNYIDSTPYMFEEGARDFVENFGYSYLMDVWVVDNSGKLIITSAGFSVSDSADMPDYSAAVKNETGTEIWTGRNSNGEKIMAKSKKPERARK